MTGDREAGLAQQVGKRVEIVGMLEGNARSADATASAGAGGVGATAGVGAATRRPAGAAMPQLTIVSFRPVEGICP